MANGGINSYRLYNGVLKFFPPGNGNIPAKATDGWILFCDGYGDYFYLGKFIFDSQAHLHSNGFQ